MVLSAYIVPDELFTPQTSENPPAALGNVSWILEFKLDLVRGWKETNISSDFPECPKAPPIRPSLRIYWKIYGGQANETI